MDKKNTVVRMWENRAVHLTDHGRRSRGHMPVLFQQGLQPLSVHTRPGLLPFLPGETSQLHSELLRPVTWIVKTIPHSVCWITVCSRFFCLALGNVNTVCRMGCWALLFGIFISLLGYLCHLVYLGLLCLQFFLTLFWKVLGHDQSSIMFSFF